MLDQYRACVNVARPKGPSPSIRWAQSPPRTAASMSGRPDVVGDLFMTLLYRPVRNKISNRRATAVAYNPSPWRPPRGGHPDRSKARTSEQLAGKMPAIG